jgi:hypothetical protein
VKGFEITRRELVKNFVDNERVFKRATSKRVATYARDRRIRERKKEKETQGGIKVQT